MGMLWTKMIAAVTFFHCFLYRSMFHKLQYLSLVFCIFVLCRLSPTQSRSSSCCQWFVVWCHFPPLQCSVVTDTAWLTLSQFYGCLCGAVVPLLSCFGYSHPNLLLSSSYCFALMALGIVGHCWHGRWRTHSYSGLNWLTYLLWIWNI